LQEALAIAQTLHDALSAINIYVRTLLTYFLDELAKIPGAPFIDKVEEKKEIIGRLSKDFPNEDLIGAALTLSFLTVLALFSNYNLSDPQCCRAWMQEGLREREALRGLDPRRDY